jgi:hypothetical protein
MGNSITTCWTYSNGNTAGQYLTTLSSGSNTQFSVGDSMYVYCGNTSSSTATYYVEPIEGECLDTKTSTLEVIAHKSIARASMSGAAFDRNMNALTAGGNTTTADYDLTLGANQEEPVYAEWTIAAANSAYNAIGIAIAVWNDIAYAKPANDQGLSIGVTPDYLKAIKVGGEVYDGNQTLTFDTYYFGSQALPSPKLLKAYDSLKIKLLVKGGATDPSATDNVFSTIDGVVVCLLDGQYTKDTAGNVFMDLHNHAESGSQADVGVPNLFMTPVGSEDCIVFEGN